MRKGHRARRAGAVAGSVAAAAVATVVTGAPAAAEVLSRTRTDAFTFTVSGTTTSVTCNVTSTLEYDTSTRAFTAGTRISGTERPECRGSWPEVTVVTPDGTHHARGYGGIVDLSYGPTGNDLRSSHVVYFQACDCTSPTWNHSLPK